LARYNFAPSQECVQHLLDEHIDKDSIIRTAHNTGIDALLLAREFIQQQGIFAQPTKHILVTAHRRESWGAPMREIFTAIAEIAKRKPDYHISLATHANPIVTNDAYTILESVPNVTLLEHQSYDQFIVLMSHSELILTDSGGIQEEGPTLGIPVIVLRNKTEYHELLDDGVMFLAGTKSDSIVETTLRILSDVAIKSRLQVFACQRAQQSSIPLILDTIAGIDQSR
jgi:UDP-N-acetylglucosamine 2-epimerase (non-hydrolysing)